jgi:hypothetical protein
MPLCTCGCGRNISRQQIYNHITCGAPLSIQISHAASQNLDDLPPSPVGSAHDTALAEVNRKLEYAAPRDHGDAYPPEPCNDLTIPNDAIHRPCLPGNLLPSAEVKLRQAESTWDWVDKGLLGVCDEDQEPEAEDEEPLSHRWDNDDLSDAYRIDNLFEQLEREKEYEKQLEIVDSCTSGSLV